VLRRPRASDEDGYVRVFLRPEVNAWLRPAPFPPVTAAEAAAMLGEDLRQWRELGFGPWAVVEDEEGAYVGRAGLRETTISGSRAVELAWAIDPDFHGRGLATEAAVAAIELGREVGLQEVVALALPANTASRRVAEKAGMEASGEIEHAGMPHVLYRLRLS
jgi:RimJ/RimL family protein N-acetyltransferase